VDSFESNLDVGQFRFSQLPAQASQFPAQPLLVDGLLSTGAGELVLRQADRFTGAPLRVDATDLEFLQRALRRSQTLLAFPEGIVFVAQGIDAQGRVRRRAAELGQQSR